MLAQRAQQPQARFARCEVADGGDYDCASAGGDFLIACRRAPSKPNRKHVGTLSPSVPAPCQNAGRSSIQGPHVGSTTQPPHRTPNAQRLCAFLAMESNRPFAISFPTAGLRVCGATPQTAKGHQMVCGYGTAFDDLGVLAPGNVYASCPATPGSVVCTAGRATAPRCRTTALQCIHAGLGLVALRTKAAKVRFVSA